MPVGVATERDERIAQCSYCGHNTLTLFGCKVCYREGCYECMPLGPDEPCPKCKENETA